MLICLLTCLMLPTLNTVEAGIHRGMEGSAHLTVKDYTQDNNQASNMAESEKSYMNSGGILEVGVAIEDGSEGFLDTGASEKQCFATSKGGRWHI